MINGYGCAGQPHPQGFPKPSRRVDRDGLNSEAPLQGPFDQPCSDSGVVSPVNSTEDLPSIQINNRRHPRLDPLPRIGFRIFEEADGPEAVFIDANHPWP